jgi:hypothetical protein
VLWTGRGKTLFVELKFQPLLGWSWFHALDKKTEFAYGGNNSPMKPDVENLVSQGLIEFKSLRHEETGSPRVLTLTNNDDRFLTHAPSTDKKQGFYHGSIKPREALHDADLYRLYGKEASQNEGQRGPDLPVVLDYELKKHLYRALPKLSKDRNSDDGKHAIPERYCIRSSKGSRARRSDRIRNSRRRTGRVDHGVATGHDRGRNLTRKSACRTLALCSRRLYVKALADLDQHELTAEIKSL